MTQRTNYSYLISVKPPFQVFLETDRIGRLDILLAAQGVGRLVSEFLLTLSRERCQLREKSLIVVHANGGNSTNDPYCSDLPDIRLAVPTTTPFSLRILKSSA